MNIKAMFYWFLGLLVLSAGVRELLNGIRNVQTEKMIGLTIELVVVLTCFYFGYRIVKRKQTSIALHSIMVVVALLIVFFVFGAGGGLLYIIR